MSFLTRNTPLVACLAALAVAGCGSQHAFRQAAAPSTAPVKSSPVKPAAGAAPAAASHKPGHTSLATGRHDHLGQLCIGRAEARYASEGMFCVAGRLERKTAAMAAGRASHAQTARRSRTH